MSITGYTKLFSSIIASTIWREDDKTRIVWITLLAMADRRGIVEASIPGLADFAHVSLADAEAALAKLMAPDPYSRSAEHDGRRIEKVDGGWFLLNHGKYRAKLNGDERREYLRVKQAEHRARVRASTAVNSDQQRLTHTEAEADTKAERTKDPGSTASVEPSLVAFTTVGEIDTWHLGPSLQREWSSAYPGVDVLAECRKARAWLQANPQRRKTAKGMPRFLLAWIGRSVDRGAAQRAPVAMVPLIRWYDECAAQHGGSCADRKEHNLKLAREVAN